MTWVTLARVIPSRRAISTWFEASPDSRRAMLGSSSGRTAGPSSWTRSTSCRWPCSPRSTRDSGRRDPSSWQWRHAHGRCADRCGDPPQPRGDGGRAHVPGRSLLSTQRLRGPASAVTITPADLEDHIPPGTCAVSVFLVNHRAPVEKEQGEPDLAYVFQPELDVRADHPFVARPDLRGARSEEWDEKIADLQASS